ncbi:MAG: GntR family transcriptional regulator [Planctomycetes bacterium]|nr:GntR family transcriptional regulator [Planctomycetota bacterium]
MRLNTYIKNDLQYRIQTDGDIPKPLTLANLSKHYDVSFTPVRAAIEELIQAGLIRKNQHNGRLEINAKKVGTDTQRQAAHSPRPPKNWDEVLIKEVMLAGLGRAATYLREEALARKYGAGRSVIRQTFSRFAWAGLIEHVPRCGWLVHPLREVDVRAYLDVRETLEIKALNLAQSHLDREDLEQMLETSQIARQQGTLPLSNQLHDYLIDRSGNRYIRDFFRQQVPVYYSALFNYAAPEASVVQEMAAQHCRILDCLISCAWSQARQALTDHIHSQARVLSKLLVLAQDRPAGDKG